jgi:hypothetical protein
MQTGECHDPVLLELAQETDRVADTLNDPVMRYEIAREVRKLAILDPA